MNIALKYVLTALQMIAQNKEKIIAYADVGEDDVALDTDKLTRHQPMYYCTGGLCHNAQELGKLLYIEAHGTREGVGHEYYKGLGADIYLAVGELLTKIEHPNLTGNSTYPIKHATENYDPRRLFHIIFASADGHCTDVYPTQYHIGTHWYGKARWEILEAMIAHLENDGVTPL